MKKKRKNKHSKCVNAVAAIVANIADDDVDGSLLNDAHTDTRNSNENPNKKASLKSNSVSVWVREMRRVGKVNECMSRR